MIDPATCLAAAIFWEARGEPLQGQIAVGQVIMNRVESERYPSSVCDVISQNYQFSYYNDDIPNQIPVENKIESYSWQVAKNIASVLLDKDSEIYDYSKGALHYAVTGVDREWMHGVESFVIGDHTFYIGVR